jgi:hypothetical protein
MHPAICGQVIKKKYAPCVAGTDQHVRIRSMYVNVRKYPRNCVQRSKMCTLCTKCTYFLKIAGGKSLQRAKQLTIGELYVYDKTVKITPLPGLSSWVKSVARKSPSHVLYYAPVRSLKKSAPSLGTNISAGNGPIWRLKDAPTAAIFCCKSTDMAVLSFFLYRKSFLSFLFLLFILKIPSAQCVKVSKYIRA